MSKKYLSFTNSYCAIFLHFNVSIDTKESCKLYHSTRTRLKYASVCVCLHMCIVLRFLLIRLPFYYFEINHIYICMYIFDRFSSSLLIHYLCIYGICFLYIYVFTDGYVKTKITAFRYISLVCLALILLFILFLCLTCINWIIILSLMYISW